MHRPENLDQIYEVWMQLEFESPMFPHGKSGDKDAISYARDAYSAKGKAKIKSAENCKSSALLIS